MGEPLSPDRVLDFPMDEPEPHPAYDFFMPGLLPDYAGNPNNANGWIEADVPLLGEMGEPLGAEVDEPMVDPVIDEVAELIAEGKKQVISPVIDVEEDIAMLFDDDDFSDDDSKGFEDDEEVRNVEVADGIAIGEIGPRVSAVEGQVQVMASQMVQVVGRLEQVGTKMEQGMDRRLADLERRPPGP
ncbi:hypothetical protein Tco_0324658 [Tanacetum coccineum]